MKKNIAQKWNFCFNKIFFFFKIIKKWFTYENLLYKWKKIVVYWCILIYGDILWIKNDKNKAQEYPVGSQDTEIEAKAFVDGWTSAVETHTKDAKYEEVLGMFRIARIDKTEELNEKGN